MARNMLKEGLNINLISKISGLTIEEIKKLTNIKNKI
jgi:predicted transposase YdaD